MVNTSPLAAITALSMSLRDLHIYFVFIYHAKMLQLLQIKQGACGLQLSKHAPDFNWIHSQSSCWVIAKYLPFLSPSLLCALGRCPLNASLNKI